MLKNETSYPRLKTLAGFSLLEILITIAITAIGLLGLAGMQAAGLRHNDSAYQTSQAAVLAYDIADRMRSNVSTVGKYLSNYSPPPGEATTAVEFVNGIPTVIVTYAESEEKQIEGCVSTDGCTGSQLAYADIQAWQQALVATLPLGTGAVSYSAVDNLYTVTIRWDDNRSGEIDDGDPNFQMQFRM